MTRSRVAAWGLVVAALWLTGCGGGGGAVVTRRPQWEFEQYERIAVVPASPCDPRAGRDAQLLADRMTTLLAQNGAFKVLSRSEVEQVFAEQDLSKLADAIDEGTALPEGRVKIAQALVVPRITDFKLIADRQIEKRPVYAVDEKGRVRRDRQGRPIVVREETVEVFRHGAEVEASVRVVDAATMQILVSHTARVTPRTRTNRGAPPSMSPQDIATEAIRELSVDFYKAVAPTQIRVKLKSKMLVLATAYFDGRYDEVKEVSPTLETIQVVVRDLPEECDRNDFHVAISAEGGRANLFDEAFTWSGTSGPEGISYQVPVQILKDAGGRDFVAKLYSAGNPEPVLERKFKLDIPKEKD